MPPPEFIVARSMQWITRYNYDTFNEERNRSMKITKNSRHWNSITYAVQFKVIIRFRYLTSEISYFSLPQMQSFQIATTISDLFPRVNLNRLQIIIEFECVHPSWNAFIYHGIFFKLQKTCSSIIFIVLKLSIIALLHFYSL